MPSAFISEIKIKRFILLQTLLQTILIFSPDLMAEELVMGFGEKLPPYIIPEKKSGIELDIVREALELKGHKLKPEFLPMARLALTYQNKNVDAIMMDVGEKISPPNGYYADIPVVYKNVFITLKKRHLVIKKPVDLKNLNVNGFIGAEKRYPEWLTTIKKAGTYFEKNDQSLQVQQLAKERIDAALSEYNIFAYYFSLADDLAGFKLSDFETHNVLNEDPLNYRPVFRSQKIRDDFNGGLKMLKKSGRYQAIFDGYLKSNK